MELDRVKRVEAQEKRLQSASEQRRLEENEDDLANQVAKAVYHWVSFELISDRGMILSEYALRFPVGIVLTSEYPLDDGWAVCPEDSHPVLKGKSIDFTVSEDTPYEAYINGERGKLILAIEMKYFCIETGKANLKKQRIVDDICRLRIVDEYQSGVHRLFLWVGRLGDGVDEKRSMNREWESAVSFLDDLLQPEIRTKEGKFKSFFSKWTDHPLPEVIHSRLINSFDDKPFVKDSEAPPHSRPETPLVRIWRIF